MGEAVPSSSTKSGQHAASPHGTQLTSCTPKLARVCYCMGGLDGSFLGDLADISCFPSSILSAVAAKSNPPTHTHTQTKKQQIEVGWAMAVVTSGTGMFTVGHMRFL